MRRAAGLRIAAVLVASVGLVAGLAPAASAQAPPEPLVFDGGPATAQDATPVPIDADLYLPAATPAPAVVLAHGFGGSKVSVAEQAELLAERGFVVLAYTARGFGASGGLISMNAPDFEVADAQRAIDLLAERPEVEQEAPGDPVVGFAGGSYGGALSLLVAGLDPRVDAIAADITWNDLESSLFGQAADGRPGGVFKAWWTGGFFGVGLNQPPPPGAAPALPSTCGRFSPGWCAAYLDAAERGIVTEASRELMAASSPASITANIAVPTLLGGGQADSLFPLAQVNANAEQIARAHPDAPLKVVWHGGGHDGGLDEGERLDTLVADWMDAHLRGIGSVPGDFEATIAEGSLGGDSNARPAIVSLPEYPGLAGNAATTVELQGPPQPVRAPAGGVPAAISTLPGLGGAAGTLASALGGGLPGQVAVFESEPLERDVLLGGSSRVRLLVSSTEPVRDAVLFASLRIASATGTSRAPQGLVAPIAVGALSQQPIEIEVDLPAVVARAAAGDRLQLVVSTTDAAYRLPSATAVYGIALATGDLEVATLDGVTATGQGLNRALLLAIPIVLGIVLVSWLLRRRVPRGGVDPALAATPVSIRGLSKTYRGGLRAVDDVSFEVPPGIVLGLLGPNGAGKTTTMRMLMGLITPTEGDVRVFGEVVHPGAPVLARVGALVEGAGFLPHLTGRQNLDLYWRAAGRVDEDPHLDTVLEIAGLGSAVDRKVRSYSQGMRQRLGIAQAMLGYPDLLMLDEPTNGLDPPQIREMRDVLRDYAATGRTVIVSSHLLAEVEMTCTHVVVMHRGRLVAQGEVGDLLAGRTGQRLEDVFLEIVGEDRTVGGG